MAKVYFKSFYKCKEKLQDISYIKDIIYTQVFFIWEINCKLRVASCVSLTFLPNSPKSHIPQTCMLLQILRKQ